MSTRERDTPYTDAGGSISVATPSCCCCCCCLTALIVVPVATVLATNATAAENRKSPVVAGLATSLGMATAAVGSAGLIIGSAFSSIWVSLLVSAVVATVGVSAGRMLAGVPTLKAVGWSVLVVVGWAAAITVNLYFDGATLGTSLVFIEWLLIPVWVVVLIVRWKNRRDDIRAAQLVDERENDKLASVAYTKEHPPEAPPIRTAGQGPDSPPRLAP